MRKHCAPTMSGGVSDSGSPAWRRASARERPTSSTRRKAEQDHAAAVTERVVLLLQPDRRLALRAGARRG